MNDALENDFQSFRDDFENDKITLLPRSKIMQRRRKLDRKTVVLKGRLINDYNYKDGQPLDLQACSTTAFIVDEDDFETRF